MKRRSPVRHKVRSHTREGKRIESFERGKGTRKARSHRSKTVGTVPEEISFRTTFPKDREQVSRAYPGHGPYRDVDAGIREVVIWFNEHGFPTFASCESHPSEKGWVSYISFDDPRPLDTLLKFGKNHMTPQRRHPDLSYTPTERIYWEDRNVMDDCTEFAKILPDSYIILHIEKWKSLENLRKGMDQDWLSVPRNERSWLSENRPVAGKLKSAAFYIYPRESGQGYILQHKHLKTSGGRLTQAEWDKVRNESWSWIANMVSR